MASGRAKNIILNVPDSEGAGIVTLLSAYNGVTLVPSGLLERLEISRRRSSVAIGT